MLNGEDLDYYQSIFKDIDPEDLLRILAMARVRTLRPGEVYIPIGSCGHTFAYIKQGLIRAYQEKNEDTEITFMLRWEHQFVASLENILQDKPSRWIYQALEATELLELDYRAVRPVIDASPGLSSARSSFLLQMLSGSMERLESFVLLSPEERYRKMVAEKPDIINRVADKHLATLLGITPVSLSRIRKRLAGG